MSKLRDPFNPKSGKFAENIRASLPPDDTELRESLKLHGWHPEFPALVDENGIVLVGNRRFKIAEEERIEPVTKLIMLGRGDNADAERLKIAIISNIGHKPLTKEDRQRIAKYLYGTKDWTMEQIAKALNVSAMQISRDLGDFNTTLKSKHSKTASNPKGSGRPKGSRKPKPSPVLDKAREAIRPHVRAGGPISRDKIATEAGIGLGSLQVAEAYERGVVEGEKQIRPEDLSLTAQEKLSAAIRQSTRRLEADFTARVRSEAQQLIEDTILPAYNKERTEYREVIKSRKGIMDRRTFRKIWKCLHPDWMPDEDKKKTNEEAFSLFSKLETVLLDEKERPTDFPPLPRTYEEMMAAKAKTSAARKANRSAVRMRNGQ